MTHLFFSGIIGFLLLLLGAALLANRQNLRRVGVLAEQKRMLLETTRAYADSNVELQQRVQHQEKSILFLLGEMGLELPQGTPFELPPQEK